MFGNSKYDLKPRVQISYQSSPCETDSEHQVFGLMTTYSSTLSSHILWLFHLSNSNIPYMVYSFHRIVYKKSLETNTKRFWISGLSLRLSFISYILLHSCYILQLLLNWSLQQEIMHDVYQGPMNHTQPSQVLLMMTLVSITRQWQMCHPYTAFHNETGPSTGFDMSTRPVVQGE